MAAGPAFGPHTRHITRNVKSVSFAFEHPQGVVNAMNRCPLNNRRDFLKSAGVGTAAYLVAAGATKAEAMLNQATAHTERPLKLALASYTLRKFSLEDTIEMTKRLALKAICFKSFHLPLDASSDVIKLTLKKVNAAGIELYGGGVISLKNDEQVNQAFEYAKAAGMSKIIGAPTPKMLPMIHDKVQEYDMQVCIHNHGPGDEYFPTPTAGYDKIKSFDKRIGFCHDVGHTVRYGEDPIAATRQCADRILDVHMKDVTQAAPAGHATPCGRGVIDIPALISTLIEIEYQGFLAFEYEEQPNDPLPGLAESVGYVRGVLDNV
jgi:inosose dehydratase